MNEEIEISDERIRELKQIYDSIPRSSEHMKLYCVMCNRKLDADEDRYKHRGNYCVECNARMNSLLLIRTAEKQLKKHETTTITESESDN